MKIYLGLGSNLGNKEENIRSAIQKIYEQVGEVQSCSSLYYSQPQGFISDNSFVNAVIQVETLYSPLRLLHQLQGIEKEMGRTEKTAGEQYSDRIIDIDILLYENLQIDLPELKIPHPQMKTRDFVLKPLKEILGLT